MQTYFVWVCAGRVLSQPDARRSSEIEQRVLFMKRSSFLAPFKGERLYYFARNWCGPLMGAGFAGSIFCGHFWLSSDLEENSLLQ